MVDRDRAGLAEARHGGREIDARIVGVDRAAESSVGAMMIVDRALMAARDHQHRAVFRGEIVEHDADRGEVVVGMRVERPILVPFDRGAVTGRFHVELAGIQANAAPQFGEDRDHRRVPAGALVGLVARVRRLDPPHPRLGGPMRVFEVVDLVVGRDLGRVGDELVGDRAQFGDLARRKDAGDDDKAVVAVGGQLAFGQHVFQSCRIGSPRMYLPRQNRRVGRSV